LDDLSITVDAYSIAMGGRIINTSTVHSTGTGIISPLVGQAILAHGNVLDPTAGQQGVSSYVNGLDTLTEGVDLTVNYLTDLDNLGSVNWTLAGNYNQTAISDVSPPPAVLVASNPGATFFTDETLYNFVHRQPNVKVGLSANWSLDQWGVTLRETVYGSRKGLTSPDSNPPYVDANQPGVGITDLEVRYNITDDLRFAVGGNNIFNIAAEGACDSPITNANGGTNVCSLGTATTYASIIHSPLSTEFDPYGGYYYGRITYNF
jgi:iron complex outermembrane receptor protein